jgi:serine phosphatase RsbU (regulator of sigma subunit)
LITKERERAEFREAKLRAEAAEAHSKLIQAENDRKTKELEEARQLQLSMLPEKLPNLLNLDIAVFMKTATEVGGDYYDFSFSEDGSLNLAIGDATGHGLKAGIMVSAMKSIFITNSSKMDIEEFFITANTSFKSMNLKRMMMGFTMLNIKNNHFSLINAGMPPVFWYCAKSRSVKEIQEHGIPVGAMNNFEFKSVDGFLEKGDVILLLTDGLPELKNGKNEMYGYKQIRDNFKKIAQEEPKDIIDYLKNETSGWSAEREPDDDITFISIKFK